jgi:eukaryotic translation initiation factor 2C
MIHSTSFPNPSLSAQILSTRTGKECTITLNTFNVLKQPNRVVYQYDVSYAGDSKDYTKRKLLEKIWTSKAVKKELGEKQYWVWDGHRLAW